MYPVEFLACKASRNHHWEDSDPNEWRKPDFGYRWAQRCVTCGGLRSRLISRVTGAELTAWMYRMPDGYKPAAPMTTADFRREYFRRVHGRRSNEKRRHSQRKVAS